MPLDGQNQSQSEFVCEKQFNKTIDAFLNTRNDKEKPLWTRERIEETIAYVEQYKSATTQKLKRTSKHYYYGKKYDVVQIGTKKSLILKRNDSDPVVKVAATDELYQILCEVHRLTGHGGRDKMINNLKTRYSIPSSVVQEFLKMCIVCRSKRKHPKKRNRQLTQPKALPGASGSNPSANISLDPDNLGLKICEGSHDGSLHRCRFCAEYSKECVDVTHQDRPYLTRNKTALTINNLSVELDFNDEALPKTVCGICDRKLQAMFDFVQQAKNTQESLVNVRNYVEEEFETVIVKTECESPTPDDIRDDIDSKDGIIDSITVTETEFVKSVDKREWVEKKTPEVTKDVGNVNNQLVKVIKKENNDEVRVKPSGKCKRESVEDTHLTQKKAKVMDVDEEYEMIADIKEETSETFNAESEDLGLNKEAVTLPCEFESTTNALVNE